MLTAFAYEFLLEARRALYMPNAFMRQLRLKLHSSFSNLFFATPRVCLLTHLRPHGGPSTWLDEPAYKVNVCSSKIAQTGPPVLHEIQLHDKLLFVANLII